MAEAAVLTTFFLHSSITIAMKARKPLPTSRKDLSTIVAQAEANGYVPGAHTQDDKEVGKNKFSKSNLQQQEYILKVYVAYVCSTHSAIIPVLTFAAGTGTEPRKNGHSRSANAPSLPRVVSFLSSTN